MPSAWMISEMHYCIRRISTFLHSNSTTLENWVDDRLLIAKHLLSEPNCSIVLQFMWPVMLFTSHVFLTAFRELPYYYSFEDTLFVFLFPAAVPKLHIPLDGSLCSMLFCQYSPSQMHHSSGFSMADAILLLLTLLFILLVLWLRQGYSFFS